MTETATDNTTEIFGLDQEESEKAAEALWRECENRALSCDLCTLAQTRKNVVFGEGDRRSNLMFIGEGPGETEDDTGRPFVGKAGQLLTQILASVGIERDHVYIANVVKCRPPGNRTPLPEESAACDKYLQTQILLIKPTIIVLLGLTPTKWILKTTEGITKLRGRWFDWRGISVMPMFHPSYLLRFAGDKKPGSPKHLSWLDIQEVKKRWDIARGQKQSEEGRYE